MISLDLIVSMRYEVLHTQRERERANTYDGLILEYGQGIARDASTLLCR